MSASKIHSKTLVNTDQTVSEALGKILHHNFDYLLQWQEAARSWENIEGVHQMRVALRRMRSALSSFRSAVPKTVAADWYAELGWLASQLGMARDLDVFISEGLGAVHGKLPLPGEEKLLALAEARRAEAYKTVVAMLDSERYAQFKLNFLAWVVARGWEKAELPKKNRQRLSQPIQLFARQQLDRLEGRVLAAGGTVDRNSAEQMHRLRIECKKLRYGAEFFMTVIRGLDEFIDHMRGLQDLLGILNDVAVMKHLLAHVLQDQGDSEVMQYAGGLVGWRTCQYYDLLITFDARWKEFVSAKRSWWTKDEKRPSSTSGAAEPHS